MSSAVSIEYSGTSNQVEESVVSGSEAMITERGGSLGRHLPVAVALDVLAPDRVPEAHEREVGLEHLVLRRVPAVVEREPGRDHRAPGADAEVDRRGGVDAVRGADGAQDAEGARGGVRELARLRESEGIVELREDERVDPLGVGRPLDALRKLRPHVLEERVAHARELPQVPVVREDDARAREVERVQVRLGDDRFARVGDPADVRDQARRRELRREEAQVAVERRQRGRAVRERILGPQRRRVPRLHAEAREVEERVHHPRAVRLPDEAVVGVEQQISHGERLTEVGQDPAHAPIVLALDLRRPGRGAGLRVGRATTIRSLR